MSARALGLLLGFAADRMLGDPQRFHPVAGVGITAAALERYLYADSRIRGGVHAGVLVGGAVALGVVADRVSSNFTVRALLTGAATWTVLGGRSLEREALAVLDRLEASDLPAAREQLTHLVGRETRALDRSEISRAVIESLAENASDAVVAPLVWGSIAGVPGLFGYRVANTLDAMVGHRNARYERFGWAAARLDDVLNLPASRLTGMLTVALGGDPPGAGRAWRRDAVGHPSPNAGVVEAAFAGSLGLRLGGTNVYGAGSGRRIEHRTVLGDGRPPVAADIPRAVRLARRVAFAAVVAVAAVSASRLDRGDPP